MQPALIDRARNVLLFLLLSTGLIASVGQAALGANDADDDIAPLHNTTNGMEVDEWLHSVRPGESLWKIAHQCCGRGLLAGDLARHNNLDPSAPLVVGARLRIPVSWLLNKPTPAQVLTVSTPGIAVLYGLHGRSIPLRGGEYIEIGDRIDSAGASVLVTFADQSRVLLGPDSEVLFDRLSILGDTTMVDTRLRMNRGRIDIDVTPQTGNGEFLISTPVSTATVRGTSFRSRYDKESYTELTSGALDVAGSSAPSGAAPTQALAAGFGLALGAGGSSAVPEALLPMTRFIAMQPTMAMPDVLRWESISGAQAYTVLLFRGAGRKALEFVRRMQQPVLELADLPMGVYEIVVRGIADSGLEGLDASATFRVGPGAPRMLTQRLSWPGDQQIDWRLDDVHSAAEVQGWHLQIYADSEQGALLVDEILDAPRYTFNVPGPGRYAWRLASGIAAPADGLVFGSVAEGFLNADLAAPTVSLESYASHSPDRMVVHWTDTSPDDRYTVVTSDGVGRELQRYLVTGHEITLRRNRIRQIAVYPHAGDYVSSVAGTALVRAE